MFEKRRFDLGYLISPIARLQPSNSGDCARFRDILFQDFCSAKSSAIAIRFCPSISPPQQQPGEPPPQASSSQQSHIRSRRPPLPSEPLPPRAELEARNPRSRSKQQQERPPRGKQSHRRRSRRPPPPSALHADHEACDPRCRSSSSHARATLAIRWRLFLHPRCMPRSIATACRPQSSDPSSYNHSRLDCRLHCSGCEAGVLCRPAFTLVSHFWQVHFVTSNAAAVASYLAPT